MHSTIRAALGFALLSSNLPTLAQAQAGLDTHYQFIDTYCSECHNADDWAGSLDLSLFDLDHVVADAETWEKVMRKFRGNMMPPQGNPSPSPEARKAFVSWLQDSIDSATLANPNPGSSSLHRLNRTEYGNAIRDLLHVDVDIGEFLPADDEGYGFDNIADVLRTSPSLLEQYLQASRKIAELAIGDPGIAPISKVYRVAPDLPQAQHIPGLPLGTRGGILIEHNFPLDADYDINAFLTRNIVGYMTGLEWPNQFEISIDGQQVFLAQVGGEEDNLRSDRNFAEAANAIDERLKLRVPVTAGRHQVAVTFIQKNAAESHEPLELHTRDLDLQNMNGLPTLDYVDIIGPFNATGPGDTASRRQIFQCYPEGRNTQNTCAHDILARLARQAFRRPLTDADMALLMGFYREGHELGGFERGIQTALRVILTSPQFLFRSEPDPEGVAPGEIYALDDLALASRLSFFLWSSLPDDELISLAAAGRLSVQEEFDRQVERMLADPRSQSLVSNFAAQWLLLRNLQSVNPDIRNFPNFDAKLKAAFRTETEMFVSSIIQEDRSVLDLLTADYTFVNDRLAAHYGIPNIYGSHFRRVPQNNPNRRGLLGQGSVLTVTSYPNRTSPVLRGKWVMENILGAPPPSPPPNVPALGENTQGAAALSVRERLVLHQKNPSCAGCHSVLDPLGFALENFDAVGRYRNKDEGGQIDSSGNLADGTPVNGAISLQQALLAKPDVFVNTFTEKILTYALGRGLEYYDMPVVRQIGRTAARDDYRFSALIKAIVNSAPFRLKRADGAGSETLAFTEGSL
ncbi:MAG: DUF1592 domain-containing protein [Pseudomonadales bacterium]|nr:DUF1592 domain-containing protein [Pseudomonadales bacterium]